MTKKDEALRIADEVEELADRARDAGLKTLVYLLDMAALEAANEASGGELLNSVGSSSNEP